jgi:hypothetical protein
MMSGALTEIPGLFGFILFIMGAEPLVYSAFVATSLVSSALTWPRKSQWERLAAEAPVGVPPLYDPAGAAVADPQVDFAAPQPSSDFAVSAAHSDFEQPAMSGEMGLQGRLLEEENQARAKFKMAVLVRGVSLAVVVALPVLAATLFTLTLRPRAFDESGMGMVIIFSAISAFCAIGALLLPQLMVPLTGPASSALAAPTSASASPLNQGVPGRLFARSAIAGGFTNIPALFGMILFVSFGIDLRLLAVFIAATIVSSLLTFPRWSAWDEARMEAVTYPPMG